MSYEIITVATEKKGLFDDLINNKFQQDITVLGMGQKWTGFKMKYQLVYDYIKNMENDKVIVFLDGYDSEIKKETQNAYNKFTNGNYNMLVSSDPVNKKNSVHSKQMINTFGVCDNGLMANSGMYMGKVEYVKKFLEYSLKQQCKDDQILLNRSCQILDYIKVDEKEEIFQNIMGNETEYNKKAVFVSYPLSFNFERLTRGIFEYTQYFLTQILAVYAVTIFLILLFGKDKNSKFISIFSITLFLIIWLVNSDYSCISY